MAEKKRRFTQHGVAIGGDEDLVYSGRARKSPPGAGSMVRKIYAMFLKHPEGRTVADLQLELSPGWMEYDAYRAYDQHLKKTRAKAMTIRSVAALKIPEYGTPAFVHSAQRWWIQGKLRHMRDGRSRTARREGTGIMVRRGTCAK